MDKLEQDSDNPKLKTINQTMMRFIHTVINYCSFRIRILGKYLNNAKASVTGTLKNMLSKGEITC